MPKIDITVQKNAAITGFSVVLNDNAGAPNGISDAQFTKQGAGTFTYSIASFNPGPRLTGNFTVLGQGDAVGTPLAWALFSVNGVSQNPHVVGQIFSFQTQEQTPFSIPIVGA